MNNKSRIAAGSAIAVVVVIGVTSCLAATNPSSSPTPTASTSAVTVSTVHNEADMSFAQMMSIHHQGAIEMSALAPDRASSDAVKTLAAQIQEAQEPEIQEMQSWLKTWNASMAGSSSSAMPGMSMPASAMPTSSMSGMDMPSSSSMPGMDMSGSASGMDMHGMHMPSSAAPSASIDIRGNDMPGMTDADMAKLKAAHGTAFDKLYLQLMIVHHQAAVDMSKDEIVKGKNPQALSLAADIISSQTAQITQMQNMLAAIK
jgi:uncharacterized protein (DUF305 family)